ncbi:MAG: hypothetical protein KGQ60_02010 [Planctomycetes bacterium]|nr:hypothetical protein [Planctomycetota bacterium]
MTCLSILPRNGWVWSLPWLLGAMAYYVSTLDAQDQSSASIAPEQTNASNTALGSEGGGGYGGFGYATGIGPGGMSGPDMGSGGIGGTGMGSGGMATGGMPGMGGMGMMGAGWKPRVITTWVKPEGEKPDWLVRGEKAIRARENIRRRLDVFAEIDFREVSLEKALRELLGKEENSVYFDMKGLELANHSSVEPISLQAQGTLRGLLARILHPLDLDYIVLEDGLRITRREEAIRHGSIKAYNLAYVVNDSSEGESILSTIETMIQPDQWFTTGGYASYNLIGSVLLVKASEGIHEEVQNLLALVESAFTSRVNADIPTDAFSQPVK